jgi:hypothetical protein
MDGDINSVIQQGLFDFFNKKPFAANFGKRDIQNFIAFGFDGNQFDIPGGIVFGQSRFDPVGLPQRQFAGPGPDFDRWLHEWPHPVQLPAEQPVQPDPAEVDTVWPPAPLLTKALVDMSLVTFLL